MLNTSEDSLEARNSDLEIFFCATWMRHKKKILKNRESINVKLPSWQSGSESGSVQALSCHGPRKNDATAFSLHALHAARCAVDIFVSYRGFGGAWEKVVLHFSASRFPVPCEREWSSLTRLMLRYTPSQATGPLSRNNSLCPCDRLRDTSVTD